MSIKLAAEHIVRIENAIAKIEAEGHTVDNLIELREASDMAMMAAKKFQLGMDAANAAYSAFEQPTPEQRADRDAVIREGSPQVAVFGRAAGIDEDKVREAEANTLEQLEGIENRSTEEQRMLNAMPGQREPDVSILDVEKARMDFARLAIAGRMGLARALDNDQTVTSYNLLEEADKEARAQVNKSLDADYGPGAALAVTTLRPQLELDRKLRHAIAAGAPEQEIADLREDLTASLSSADMAQGDDRLRMTVNLLPEPARSDFMEVLGDERAFERDLGPAVTAQQSPAVVPPDLAAARAPEKKYHQQIDPETVQIAEPVGMDVRATLSPSMLAVVEADQAIREVEAEAQQYPHPSQSERLERLREVRDGRVQAMIATDRNSIANDIGKLPEPQKTDIEAVVDSELSRDRRQSHELPVEHPAGTEEIQLLSESYDARWALRDQAPAQAIEQTDPAEYAKAMDAYMSDPSLQWETIGAAPSQEVELDQTQLDQTQRVNPFERTQDEDKVVQLRAQTRELGQLPSTVRAAQQYQDHGMVLDRPHPTGTAHQEYDAVRRANMQQSRHEYETDPVARMNYNRAYADVMSRIEKTGQQMDGRITKRSVEEAMELAYIKGDSKMVNTLRVGLERAQEKGRDLFLSDIDPDQQDRDWVQENGHTPFARGPKLAEIRHMQKINGEFIVREPDEVGPMW